MESCECNLESQRCKMFFFVIDEMDKYARMLVAGKSFLLGLICAGET